jgi:GNAT superfamily N-acetyltransferase
MTTEERIEIRPSVEADNEALLALTKLTPMAGRISLRIDRDPNFFALSRVRGESTFFVATFEDRVIGCISVSIHDAYIRGQVERVAHGNDLKVHPDFTGRGLSVRLLFAAEKHLRSLGIDLSMSLFAEGNQRVVKLAEGNRGQAVSLSLGKFFVDQLLPSPFRAKRGVYRIEEARQEDFSTLATMLDQRNRAMNFAPPVTVSDMEEHLARRTFKKILVAREAGQIVATLTVEDTQNLRQNVLIAAPLSLRIALGLLRVATFFIQKIAVPRLGRPLRILYVRFMACAEGHEAALRPLIAEARATAFQQGFTFLSIGLHELDPLRAVVAGIPKLTFTSMAIATSLLTPDRVKTLFDQVVYEDFALV